MTESANPLSIERMKVPHRRSLENRLAVRNGVVQVHLGGNRLDVPLAELPRLKKLHMQLLDEGERELSVQLGRLIDELAAPPRPADIISDTEEAIAQVKAGRISNDDFASFNAIQKHKLDRLAGRVKRK